MNKDQRAGDEWVDQDGYPTEAALDRLRSWPVSDKAGCFTFLHAIWWAADWGWSERQLARYRVLHISTGGWSGNESALTALEGNAGMWQATYVRHRRGGHYLFKVRHETNTQTQDPTTARLP